MAEIRTASTSEHRGIETGLSEDDGKQTIRSVLGPAAKVFRLGEFLQSYVPSLKLPDTASASSNEEYAHLSGLLLVPLESCQCLGRIRSPHRPHRDETLPSLVDGVVWRLLERRDRKRCLRQDGRNVLCQGYVIGSEYHQPHQQQHCRKDQHQQPLPETRPCPGMPPGVRMSHLNSSVDFCKTSPLFQLLHSMLGDDVLRMILLHTIVFVPAEDKDDCQIKSKGNFIQLTGPPLQSLSLGNNAKRETGPRVRRSRRKRKRKRSGSQQKVAQNDASQKPEHLMPHAIIPRNALFYSNGFVPSVGLPSGHILNKPCSPEELLTEMMELRDGNGKLRTRRWKRLRESGIRVCQEILRRHRACDYARALERYCPLPDICRRRKNERSGGGGTLEVVVTPPEASASHSPAGRVVSFLSAVLSRVFPVEFWGSPQNLTHLLEHQLTTFVTMRRHEQFANKNLLHGIRVTKLAWLRGKVEGNSSGKGDGSNSHNDNNDNADGNSSSSSIKSNKNNTKTSSNSNAKNNKKSKPSRSDHETVEKLLSCALRWLFSRFIIPLLRSTFHITESEFSGKRVLYYRKPAWAIFRSLSMDKLLKEQYTEITAREAADMLKEQQMGFSRLRLLPKATGVRPIAMLCKREALRIDSGPPPLGGGGEDEESLAGSSSETESEESIDTSIGPARKIARVGPPDTSVAVLPPARCKGPAREQPFSTNAILHDAFAVLKYEHSNSRNKDAFGAGVHGLHYFYPRYRRFLEQLAPRRRESGTDMRLFFASVDIHHCYDNINQEHLLDVVSDILSEDEYWIQRYSVLHPFPSMGRVLKIPRKKVGPPEAFQPFHRTAREMAGDHHRSVFVDGANGTIMAKGEILEQLREHLTSHLVVSKGRYGDRHLLQSNGIPQGSVLSTMLCNFYYGSVERKLLGDAFHKIKSDPTRVHASSSEPPRLLARLVDDFFLAVTRKDLLEEFLGIMYRGEPGLGVHINSDKTKVNVDVKVSLDDGTEETLKANEDNGEARLFPWCGMLFDSVSGEVRVDYSRFSDGRAGDRLTVERVRAPGAHLSVQMKTFLRPRCLPILFDPFINGREVQIVNFYQMMAFGAVKTALYIRTSDMRRTVGANVPFLLQSIKSAISYAYELVNERLERHARTLRTDLKKNLAAWLGWRAFRDVFARDHLLSEMMGPLAKIVRKCDVQELSVQELVSGALKNLKVAKLLDFAEEGRSNLKNSTA